MGAQQSIQAGNAKIDFNFDLTHMLCESLLMPPLRNANGSFSQIIGRLSVKHPNIFGKSEKLDILCDKGLNESNIIIAFRKPRPGLISQQSFVFQHSVSPEIAVHGLPVDNFTRSGNTGINLSRFSFGFDINEPSTPNIQKKVNEPSNWRNTTSVKFEHIRPKNNEGRAIRSDIDGFPLTYSGNLHDNMVVLKQEYEYSIIQGDTFSRLKFQMEQGLPLLPKCLIFNRFKFIASKGLKLGPAFFLSSLTGGSMVGDMAPYQAFSIGGLGSVRGYGEGAVSSGRSCLVANSELIIPLTKLLEGSVFMDYGTDLGSAKHVPGNPALRNGKPGFGVGLGYGIRLNSHIGQLQIDCAINAFQRKTIYFGINCGGT